MTTYLCTYWNPLNDPLRERLCQEFCDRYPWVTLLQVGNDILSSNTINYDSVSVGFVDYVLINKYLEEYEVDDLVVIDTDLILHRDFRSLISNKLKDHDFVHGFNHAFQIKDEITEYFAPSFYTRGYGHTGYIQGFSHEFLKRINFKFIDKFLLGGFDYVLAQMVVGKSIEWCKPFKFYQELLTFNENIRGVKYSVLDHFVIHYYHGDPSERLTLFSKYSL